MFLNQVLLIPPSAPAIPPILRGLPVIYWTKYWEPGGELSTEGKIWVNIADWAQFEDWLAGDVMALAGGLLLAEICLWRRLADQGSDDRMDPYDLIA